MSKITVYPSKPQGFITIPPSKSISHRAIICASLSNGRSVIKVDNKSISTDINSTINAMVALGASITINNDSLEIVGIKEFVSSSKTIEIDVDESASTLRFIIPILSLFNSEFLIKGKKSLFNRPLEIYQDIYKKSQSKFIKSEDNLLIKGKINIVNKRITLNGDISSQFITGLLFMLPLLDHDTELIISNLESVSYVLLTIDILRKFGIEIEYVDSSFLKIKGKQEYKACEMKVEGDYSQFANYAVLGTINDAIICKGLEYETIQGDRAIIEKLPNISYVNDNYFIKKNDELRDLVFDITNTPDIGPILAVLLTKTGGMIKNVSRLKYKESNRTEAIITELKKFGVDINLINDNLYIKRLENITTKSIIDSHNDHRIFMSLVILATIATEPVIIDNYECVKKSYPRFLDDLLDLKVKYTLDE